MSRGSIPRSASLKGSMLFTVPTEELFGRVIMGWLGLSEF